jgi:DNA polymerase-3 subunit delta'
MSRPVATTAVTVAPVLQRIIGQERVRRQLAAALVDPVHAYLFSGPPGAGQREAALCFAAGLLCPDGGCGTCSSCQAVFAGHHPDCTLVERRGASISVGEAREVAMLAQRSPRSAAYQVLILADFHLVDEAAPALLKTIEEPPSSTIFVVLADALVPSLTTIASRCVRVLFAPLDEDDLAGALIAEGIAEQTAREAAAAAGGRLDRARLLARDQGFAARLARWRSIPDRLDGTGATIAVLVGELVEAADELVVVLKAQQASELESLRERSGERAMPGRQAIEERHRREQRRVRTDELRAGLATLASAYRARLAEGGPPRALAHALSCAAAVDEAATALVRNPNEALLLQALLLRLDQPV